MGLLLFSGCFVVVVGAYMSAAEPLRVEVRTEEEVYSFTNPDNGSGPLWSYGCTVIARVRGDVFVSQMETGEGVPPLSNTRWRLLRREQTAWACIAEAENYRQREPCPLGVTSNGELLLYVNDSVMPPGTRYGKCEPYVIRFAASVSAPERTKIAPVWESLPHFTDHSYRGFAVDSERDQLLMLNIDANTGVQHACLLSAAGETLKTDSITFPIRACYPQVALQRGAAHVLAIGDIVEPVEEWRRYKFEQTKQRWDYVFRILYYAWTRNLAEQPFGAPIEIANVDKTGGHITNHDLWVTPDGDAYILYSEREVASALLRDKFFPEKSILSTLFLAVVRNGEVVTRRVLVPGTEEAQVGCARFHMTPTGRVYAVLYVAGKTSGNVLMPIYPPSGGAGQIPIPLKRPLSAFCLPTVRAGNKPSHTVDLLGQGSANTMCYAQILLGEQG